MGEGRGWGLWTEIKLNILSEYLDRFTTASQRVTERIYLDLFAGEPANFARTTGDKIVGSAHRALSTGSPPFTRFAFFELPANAAKLEADLKAAFPQRRLKVYGDDCNVTIHQALADIKRARVEWAPTFAFVDPDGPDCHWTTLEALSRHKPKTSKSKVEFWLLFPTMFMRQLPLDGRPLRDEDVDQITRMFGTDQWRVIHELRKDDALAGREARAEYTNLMRWRIENVLGYEWTHPLEIPNERGAPIYTMIFATDHPAGTNIIKAIYKHAAQKFGVMRIQAHRVKRRKIEEAEGMISLWASLGEPDPFDVLPDPDALPLGSYEYEAPWDPPGGLEG